MESFRNITHFYPYKIIHLYERKRTDYNRRFRFGVAYIARSQVNFYMEEMKY